MRHYLAALALLTSAAAAPAAAQEMQHDTEFTIRVENVSTPMTLKLTNGESAPAPTAPVLWVIHTATDPVFTDGKPDGGMGLEHLAEDGSPATLVETLLGKPGIVAVGAVAVPEGAVEPGPILPGHAFELKVSAQPGQRITLVFMFGQSNDVFFAPVGAGIALFDDNERPLRGDITSQLVLWDAGTEVNQEPGLGPDQAPRQPADNTGAAEGGVVRLVNDGFTYPKVSDVVRVTVTPAMKGMSRR